MLMFRRYKLSRGGLRVRFSIRTSGWQVFQRDEATRSKDRALLSLVSVTSYRLRWHSPWEFHVLSTLTSASDAYCPFGTLRFYASFFMSTNRFLHGSKVPFSHQDNYHKNFIECTSSKFKYLQCMSKYIPNEIRDFCNFVPFSFCSLLFFSSYVLREKLCVIV